MKLIVDNIAIKVKYKNVKNINLRVLAPEGIVELSAPKWVKKKQLEKLIKSKMTWIKKSVKNAQSLKVIPRGNANEGDIYYFFGEKYTLKVIYIDKFPLRVEIQDKDLLIYVKKKTSQKQKESLIKEWYRERLKENIPPLIKKWENIIGVKVCDFGVKQMKTRWGTCNISTGKIWINLELIKLDSKFLEYIIVHEMVHLLERNHNGVFWSYMDKFLPNWKSFKGGLNNFVILTR